MSEIYHFTLKELTELFSIVWISTNERTIEAAITELERRKKERD